VETDISHAESRADFERPDSGGTQEPVATVTAAAIGRELDTLLAIIQMNAQVGLEIGPPDLSDLFADLVTACRRGVELSGLLARSASCESPRGPLDVAHLLETLRPMMNDLLGTAIHCDVSNELAYSSIVLGECEELEYVFLRIAVEARRAMRTGGTLRITLEDESLGHVRLVFEAIEPTRTLGPNSIFSTEPASVTPPGVACAHRAIETWGGTVYRGEGPDAAVALVLLRVAQRSSHPPVTISSDRIRSIGCRRASVETIPNRSRNMLRQSRETLERMHDACGHDAAELLIAPERPLLDAREGTCREGVPPSYSSTSSMPSTSTARDR